MAEKNVNNKPVVKEEIRKAEKTNAIRIPSNAGAKQIASNAQSNNQKK